MGLQHLILSELIIADDPTFRETVPIAKDQDVPL
jgi:hypothetical protein